LFLPDEEKCNRWKERGEREGIEHTHQLKTIFTFVTLFLPLDGGGQVGVKRENNFLASFFITLPYAPPVKGGELKNGD